MSSAVPAIPLFGDAYLADTRHLTLEEHGAYLQLIMIAWRIEGCCLPDDDARLARMLGVTGKKWAKLKPVVMAFWTMTDAGWEQKRLSKERRFVTKKQEQNREAANARWGGKSLGNKGEDDADASVGQSERNAPPPPPPQEEVSVADATGAEAPKPTAIDLKAAVFATGVPLLTSTGTTDRSARSMIGRWRQTFGDGAVLDALSAATAESPSEPIPWITRTLEKRNGNRPANDRSEPQNPMVRAVIAAEHQRRAGEQPF